MIALEIVIRITAVFATALVATLAMRRSSAALRHIVLVASVVGALVLPFAVVVTPAWRVPVLPPNTQLSLQSRREDARASARDIFANMSGAGRTNAPTMAASAAGAERSGTATQVSAPSRTARHTPMSRTGALVWMWISGVVAVLAWFINGRFALARIGGKATMPSHELGDALVNEAKRAGVTRGVRLLLSSQVTTPVTFGAFRPTIVMPSNAEEWGRDRISVIFAHELAHIRRADAATQSIANIVCAFYWFHPMSWLAASRMQLERERACDDRVLEQGMTGADYAEHLLDLVRFSQRSRLQAFVAMPIVRKSQLEKRVRSILNDSERRVSAKSLRAATVMVAMVALAALTAFQPSPRYSGDDTAHDVQAPQALKREAFTRSLGAVSGGRLVVDVQGYLPLEILGVDSGLVSVRGAIAATAAPLIKLEKRGGDIVLTIPSGVRNGSRAVVHVPSNFNVHVQHANGSLRIADVQGRFTGEVDDGLLDLERVEGSADMNVAYRTRVINANLDGSIRSAKNAGIWLSHTTGSLVATTAHLHRSATGEPFDTAYATEAEKQVKEEAREAAGPQKPLKADTIVNEKGRLVIDAPAPGAKAPPPRLYRILENGSIYLDAAPYGAYLITRSGNVNVGRAGDIFDAVTWKGDITVKDAAPLTFAGTAAGNIDVTINSSSREMMEMWLATNSGNVVLTIPRNFAAYVELETSFDAAHQRTNIVTPFSLRARQFSEAATPASPQHTVLRSTGQIGGASINDRLDVPKIKVTARNGSVTIRYAD